MFATLAPGSAAATPTPGRRALALAPGSAEQGYLHCGPHGAGHFVKMVHNGIEYGIMGAYAEGFNILRHADAGKHSVDADAETAPMADPAFYQYALDLPQIAELWRRGSVIGSWLLDLTAAALQRDPTLAAYAGRVFDSGEGRWTLAAAIDEAVPAPILSAALFARFGSRGKAEYAGKLLSAMRQGFGGHQEQAATIAQADAVSEAGDIVLLLDCDNTLLDNDRVQQDLRTHMEQQFGAPSAERRALLAAVRTTAQRTRVRRLSWRTAALPRPGRVRHAPAAHVVVLARLSV